MLKHQIISDEFLNVVDINSDEQVLAEGFRFLEGPVWDGNEKTVTFSDVRASVIYRWRESNGAVPLIRDTEKAIGNTYDREGRLLTCTHKSSQVVRYNADGTEPKVMASHYLGKELNSPNDIIVRSDGKIYFTDPHFGRRNTPNGFYRGEELPQEKRGVYMLEPVSGELTQLYGDFITPNGLCFSPDEKLLYVAASMQNRLFVFDVREDGTIENCRLFAHAWTGDPDGLKCDSAGNIYAACLDGIQVYDKTGKPLGIVNTSIHTTNFCFGGEDMCTVYCATGVPPDPADHGALLSFRTLIPGIRIK